jgi:filamentous hemagglutinin family protein
MLWIVTAQAQVITDGSLGTQVNLSGANYVITQDLGTLQGTNLFHSFAQFSLDTGETATFSGDAGIQNIFSRVTGGQISTIDGVIRNTIPNADLYLMNPAGIVFNQNASLDLQGSFYATTADVIRFSDKNDFYANSSQNSILSTARPSAFGFLNNEIGKIAISGTKNIITPRSKNLNFIGGDLNIDNAVLFAGGGQIQLASIGASSEIKLQPDILSTTILDNLTIRDSSITANTNINDTTTGSIYIRAEKFTLQDSTITNSTDSATLEKGGNIDIQGKNIVFEGSTVASENTNQTRGGDILIQAQDNITLMQGSKQNVTSNSRISIANSLGATGRAGQILITSKDVHIQDGSQLQSTTLDAGDAGEIDIVAKNVYLNGQNNVGSSSSILAATGANRIVNTNTGKGGSVSINTVNLTMNDGANINANTYSQGDAGNIYIYATEKITLEQESNAGIGNSISSAAVSNNTGENDGNGGNIFVTANDLLLANGSFLTTNTTGAGNAGDIEVTVKRNATITGISAQTDSGILSAASSSSTGGHAGNILLNVGNQLLMDDLAIIDVSTFSRGLGGDIKIIAGDMLMQNEAYIGAASASSGNTGDINILITHDNLEMYNQSYITTSATYADGGNINVSMPNYVYVSENSQITTSIESGVGGGGNIDLDAEFTLLGGGQILAQAYGGPGGNIDIVTTSIYNLTKQPIEQAISASSQLGVDGVVTVRSPDSDTDEGVLILNGDFLQADRLLRSLCDTKRNKANSFVVTGQESYSDLIGDWLPSNATQLVLQRCE